MPKKFLVLALATFSLILVACSSTDDTQLPSPVEVTREVEVTRLVPVEVTRDIPKEVPVAVTRQIEVTREVPIESTREVEVTRQIEVTREVPIESTREVEVTRQIEVTREVPIESIREVEVTRQIEVIREVPIESVREVEVTRQIEVIREVEVIHEVPVTVVHQPTEPPVPEVQSYSGVGDDVLSCRLSSGNNVFEFTHSGHGHFAVWVHDDEGDRDLLVNEVGKYEGVNFVRTGSSYVDLAPGPCILEITADGSWTAEIRTNP